MYRTKYNSHETNQIHVAYSSSSSSRLSKATLQATGSQSKRTGLRIVKRERRERRRN